MYKIAPEHLVQHVLNGDMHIHKAHVDAIMSMLHTKPSGCFENVSNTLLDGTKDVLNFLSRGAYEARKYAPSRLIEAPTTTRVIEASRPADPEVEFEYSSGSGSEYSPEPMVYCYGDPRRRWVVQ
jgi:hypothetical protein